MGSNSGATVCQVDDLAAARPGLDLEEELPGLSTRGLSTDRRSLSGPGTIRDPYSVIFLYSQSTPVMSAPNAPAHEATCDSFGMITVQRCQNSAPAGFILRVSGGLIAVNIAAVLFAVSNNGSFRVR